MRTDYYDRWLSHQPGTGFHASRSILICNRCESLFGDLSSAKMMWYQLMNMLLCSPLQTRITFTVMITMQEGISRNETWSHELSSNITVPLTSHLHISLANHFLCRCLHTIGYQLVMASGVVRWISHQVLTSHNGTVANLSNTAYLMFENFLADSLFLANSLFNRLFVKNKLSIER
jgi:hypothetical protein